MFKVSIITVTYNSDKCISSCLDSIASQTYEKIEHIIIDGKSKDKTLEIIHKHPFKPAKVVSEKDRGIYDALNKGFALATGNIIGILHSDDYYAYPGLLEDVAEQFSLLDIDYLYSNVDAVNRLGKIIYSSRPRIPSDGTIKNHQIPHPGLFISRNLLKRINPPFDSSYLISADLKQQLIIANVIKAKGFYLNKTSVRQRLGGKSTKNIFSYIKGWIEARRAWNEVHGKGGSIFVMKKVFNKTTTFIDF